MPISATDLTHLSRAVDLAEEALSAGDEPFGSVLVGADGAVLFEDHNRVGGGDATQHPEFAIARWAAAHLAPEARATATVYTSTEHCPMCAAAHGWVGLGRIVFASSGAQVAEWVAATGAPAAPVTPLPVPQVAPGVHVDGPVPELAERVRDLQQTRLR